MNIFNSFDPIWYGSLIKPSWTPEPNTIGLIWMILYPIIIFSAGVVLYKVWNKQWPSYLLVVFGFNLVTNLLFTPIQFGLQNLTLASVDIILVLVTIILEIIFLWRYSKILSLFQVPYLVWVCIATILQFSITFAN